jgi:hypothetical protein
MYPVIPHWITMSQKTSFSKAPQSVSMAIGIQRVVLIPDSGRVNAAILVVR